MKGWGLNMRRRDFVGLVGGAAAWPLAARAQQPAMPVIGWLQGGADQPTPELRASFSKGLNEVGYVEGRNVTIELRGAEQYNQIVALANELVQRRVTVIYAVGTSAAQAARAATATIPIVFTGSGDPVRFGLVASLSRPGGNATGMTSMSGELGAKRLELLRELVPQATTIGVLTNPTSVTREGNVTDVQAAARSVGQEIIVLNAGTADEIDRAFATAAERRIGALLVDSFTFFTFSRRDQLVALAARYAIPANYNNSEIVVAGGLMSYGADTAEYRRQSGVYVGRILKGEKPADLPVIRPAKFDFAINLKTAKALGIDFPPSFHLRATQVIE
jgi:putative ABC transport system substrate-binding protein